MLKIAVVDDDMVFVNKLSNIIAKTCNQSKIECSLQKYSNGMDILSNYSQFHLIFLDIEMPFCNGIETAEKINKLKGSSQVPLFVFVTSHDEMMSQAFGVNVIGFVTKCYLKSQLPVILNSAIKRVMNTVNIDGIDSRKICYIEAEHVYNILHLEDGSEMSVRRTSAQLEMALTSVGFIRIHRTYIINMAYVEHIKDKTIVVNGCELPVSSRLKSGFKKEYSKYCRENARFC